MMLQLFPMVVVVLGCTEVGEEFVAGLVSLRYRDCGKSVLL